MPPNTTVAIVGEDDTGISNIARAILGLERPLEGEVALLGIDPFAITRDEILAHRRSVGYLPAGDGLLQNLSLGENVALPLRFGTDFSERQILSRMNIMLAAFRLHEYADFRPVQANDDVKKRTALARALAFDPSMVILEEPFVGMTDSGSRGILENARGGDVEGGSRRAVLATSPNLPDAVVRRFDRRYRLTRMGLVEEE
ncbi:MAG: ATP-binding cassette domain-containing protein [Gemmatimonadota bacterium]|nr:ATP-binding cassette domain-containing protein [Gemmatimonadota bacterium]